MSSELWVKLGNSRATQVSTNNCTDVYDFLKACKKELKNQLDTYDLNQLSLSTTEGGEAIRPGLPLTDILHQPDYSLNTARTPLFIRVVDNSAEVRTPNPLRRSDGLTGNTPVLNNTLGDPNTFTLEDALQKLENMINLDAEMGLFTNYDSLDNTIFPFSNLLKFPIPSVYSNPEFLFSKEIYETERKIGIDMPVDKLLKLNFKAMVLIGVSGCGKTRTCYDYCRAKWGLFFDCTTDSDFLAMIKKLLSKCSPQKTVKSSTV